MKLDVENCNFSFDNDSRCTNSSHALPSTSTMYRNISGIHGKFEIFIMFIVFMNLMDIVQDHGSREVCIARRL